MPDNPEERLRALGLELPPVARSAGNYVPAVRDDRYTHDIILESGTFALSVLREDQVNVAVHFAETSGEYHDKLHGIPYGQSQGGSPVLLDCLAYLDCRVLDTARAGDHTVFIGEVTAGESYGRDYPLLYDPAEYEEALR